MASKSAYDNLINKSNKNEDINHAFSMIVENPYRILGASTFSTEKELEELYEKWLNNPNSYKSKFDETKLGAPSRTKERMEWALEHTDSYVYKIFWFSDPIMASKLGNKADFIEFFGRQQGINSTDYNSFLAQYMFLCVFDRQFTMREQWGIILNLINDLLNVSVGRFWGFYSGNKIEAIDNNKMAFLYNEFKDNILYPIREIVNAQTGKIDMERIIHIHSIIGLVNKPQLPFARIENILFEKLEKWFVREADYVNNVLLANVNGINAVSMEEKLAITNAYNYILNEIVPEFARIVNNIIPGDHSMNTRLRMMFSGKFIVVSKILSNAGLYNESLKLCQVFNSFFEDEYISGEINNLNKILKQDEQNRLITNAAATAMGNPAMDAGSGLSAPAEFGELEALAKIRRKEFFKKNTKKGIDYKEVLQEVLNNEMRLVSSEEMRIAEEKLLKESGDNEPIPYVERMKEAEAVVAEREAARLRLAMAELQKKHELELQNKIDELNVQYRKSMKKWIVALVVLLLLITVSVGVTIAQLMGDQHFVNSGKDEGKSGIALKLEQEKKELENIESRLSDLNASMAEINLIYEETKDGAYADQYAEKQKEYNDLYKEYTKKVSEYNQLRDRQD